MYKIGVQRYVFQSALKQLIPSYTCPWLQSMHRSFLMFVNNMQHRRVSETNSYRNVTGTNVYINAVYFQCKILLWRIYNLKEINLHLFTCCIFSPCWMLYRIDEVQREFYLLHFEGKATGKKLYSNWVWERDLLWQGLNWAAKINCFTFLVGVVNSCSVLLSN
jgi:hypothetical protein